ncbi:MAG: recombination mediator RecR [Termitinemataceae bacterium]|nr:MAG: recombination mediator RecR [Termitinemataceae bacterium]
MNAIDNLTNLLSKLPSIGKKTAMRLAYYILEKDKAYALSLAATLENLHDLIKPCSVCGAWSEGGICPICSDEARDKSIICVVERSPDVQVIDGSLEFCGVFHVLGGLIAPLDGVRPSDISIDKLMERVRSGKITEVILALNPTVEGDTTALYIQSQLKDFDLKVTRPASGLPVGGDLEYADRLTLTRSFRGRISM